MNPIRFDAEQTKLLMGPGVYVFRHANHKLAYIGTTAYGMGRALSPNHKMRKVPNLTLEFIPCESESAAFDLETRMLRESKPTYNVMLNGHGYNAEAVKAWEKVVHPGPFLGDT